MNNNRRNDLPSPHISLQLLIPLLLLSFTFLIAVFFFFADTRKDRLDVETDVRAKLQTELNQKQGLIEYLYNKGDMSRIAHEINSLAVDPNIKLVLLMDGGDRILTTSERGIEEDSLNEILTSRFGEQNASNLRRDMDRIQVSNESLVFLGEDRSHMFGIYPVELVLGRVITGSTPTGALLVHYDLSDLNKASFQETTDEVVITSSFLLLLTLLLWLVFFISITKRMSTILLVMNEFGGGNHRVRFVEQGGDEIAVIGKGLNQMMESIEQEIKEKTNLQDQLAQSQKMEAVGLLAGGVAHDFNNNLTAILGYADLAKQQLSESDPMWEDLNQIILSGNRAADLIRGLLAFSRKQIIIPKPSDLNELVKGTESLFRRVMGEDIAMSFSYAGHPVIVKVDKSQIEQVIINLITNSRESMPNGGSIAIATGEIGEGTGEGCIDMLDSPGNCAFISIKDNGPGIDEETQSKIFEPFFTTKEFGTGSGLGLAIVYGIVQQHHGQIKLISEPGHGTEFIICLPLTNEALIPTASTLDDQELSAAGSETILIAEDDEQVLAILRTVLQKAGYSIIEARDGDEAMEQYQIHKGSIKLLLLDVVMPNKSGIAVYELIKEHQPDIKAIFISGYARDMVEQKSMIGEGSDFIAKPFDQAELLRKIRTILG